MGGSILITVPDFTDAQLVFNEQETRQILDFFWPERTASLAGLEVTAHVRRLAQTALVGAIEGTYALGFVVALIKSLSGSRNVARWARKLASAAIGHAWRHATRNDLRDAKVYEAVRRDIASALARRVDEVINGVAIKPGSLRFYARRPTSQRFA